MAIKNLEKMDIYNPTNYVNNSEPDIDADNLNKTENKLEETVAKANEIIDALKTLISTVQTNSDNTVPSSSLAYAMQQEITKNKEDIAAANSNLVNLEDLAGLKIERGIAETNALSSGSSGYETVTIAFSQKFTAPPTISAIPATGIPNIMLSISNITVNECTFWSNRKDGNATTIHWTAVGK